MQKACVLFILFVCVNCAVVAQLPGLCNAYGALMEESFTKFAGISGKNLESPNNYKRVASTYKIKNASSCYIETSGADIYWYAEYDSFNNPDEAGLKLITLQTEFIQSFPKLSLIENTNYSPVLQLYNLKETTADGINFLKAELGVYQTNNEKYIPFFRMPENAATVHYFNINNDPDTSAFAKGINKLLKESFTGFKNILDNKISQDGYPTSLFKTNYCLPGAMECAIAEKVVFKCYEAYYLKKSNGADPYSELERLSHKVAGALGKKYVSQAIENGTLFTEVSKADVNSSWIIEVKKEKVKGNKFNILIRINEQIKN